MTQKTEKQKESRYAKAIKIQKLSKVFHSESGSTVSALHDINLTVNSGEFITVLGATGCGKTTLLNLIAGLDIPDEGYLDLNDNLKFGMNIAYVFQHYTLFPWRTTLNNVAFALEMRGISKQERKLEAVKLLSKVGLEGFENAYTHELSGGMRQRAAIAQALAMKPKLLLMDEPFGAVDDSTRADLQRMIIQLWHENQITIIFVTHNIDEAIILGDRVLVLSERPGKIVNEFDVNLPRPRNHLTPEFTEFFMKIRQTLSGQLD
ncbi:MAG: ABC transporter ATP-binding protein [Sedimentisphaerales bacterium]|nr:ABC transporter ATP-binding protein [Sedimentisphaerales bacterium]